MTTYNKYETTLAEAITKHLEEHETLKKEIERQFPRPSVCHDSVQYVICWDVTDGLQVNCLFENGNHWYRDVFKLRHEPDQKKWPAWIFETGVFKTERKTKKTAGRSH